VVVQSDGFNRSALRTVVIVAVTTNTRLSMMPGNVFVASSAGGLRDDSVINVSQVAAVDKRQLEARIGTLPDHLFADVERGLRQVLGL
jgi:mRNA interferase MazF